MRRIEIDTNIPSSEVVTRKPNLKESIQIGLAKKAWASLSKEAKTAITEWETANWTGGALERHILADDEVAKEIAEAIKPVVSSIGKPTIRLYRGEIKSDWDSSVKVLESWTTDRTVAEHFAGLRTAYGKSLLVKVITDEEIEKAVNKLDTTGYVKVDNHKYIKKPTPEWPEGWSQPKSTYYHIYSGNEFVTDGDDLRSSLKDTQKWQQERNDKLLRRAIIREEDIDVRRIVWVTNNLNSKEFIIRKKG